MQIIFDFSEMPRQRCLVNICKEADEKGHKIYPIPDLDTVGPDVRNKWLQHVRGVLGNPYGVCARHFTGI